MAESRRRRAALATLCAALATLTSGACATTDASGELRKWDQERVTQIAVELAAAAKAVRQGFREQPVEAIGTQERSHYQFFEVLKALEKATQQLAFRLKGGGGFRETLPIAKKIRSLLREAETQGRSLMSSDQMERLYVPADRLLDEIAPYYFAEA